MNKRLGRGLADIIEAPAGPSSYVTVPLDQIRTGRYQPRSAMSAEGLEELAASIKKSGVIEPVIVRPIAHGTYELVAGERRLRAARAAGRTEIPAIVRTLSDKEALEVSLVENVQREELNALEEAKGYARLINEFGYRQEEVAEAVGKDRATVANMLRLLTLPEVIQQGLFQGVITMGHAKALLSVESAAQQEALYRQLEKERLSVRKTEALAGALGRRRARRLRQPDAQVRAIEGELRRALGTKVSIAVRKKGGRIVIEYFSPEDLTRLAASMGAAVDG